jgi:glycosyltransferase involved in cell wall biosynthesis
LDKKYHHIPKTISHKILAHRLAERNSDATAIYAFDTGALESFQNPKYEYRVLEQCVAPRTTQSKIYEQLAKYNPVLERLIQPCRKLHQRELEEWRLADLIICPSKYVKHELVKSGANKEKVVTIPYSHSFDSLGAPPQKGLNDVLQVVFIGNDGFRKGLHDLIEAVRSLDSTKFTFKIVGSLSEVFDYFSDFRLPNNISFLGKISHDEVGVLLRDSDIFVLPSYLEGSAVATYEAMAFGLCPVVSEESGSVVQDGLNGMIVKSGKHAEIATVLNKLEKDRELLRELAGRAYLDSRNHTPVAYKKALEKVL